MSEKISAEDETEGTDRNLDEVTKEAARARRDTLLERGFDEDNPVLIEALPAVGKSYGIVKWAAETGNPVTVFTERHELYDQYEEWATDDFDLTAQQLPVFHDKCPTVNGETPIEFESSHLEPIRDDEEEELREKVYQKYDQGVSGRELHNRATTYFGEELPCQSDGPCPYMEALDSDTDEVDVLIGNFRQVFAEQYREGRYIVFDEFPNESFIQKFSSGVVSQTVGRFLSYSSDLPFDHWDDLLEYDHETQNYSEVGDWLENRSHDRETQPLYRGSNAQIDARGPLLTEVGIRLGRLDNGWRRADLGNGRIGVLSPNNRKLSLLDPPPINDTQGVVALDGTPCREKWELLLGQNLQHVSVLSKEEKREFLQDVLEIHLIQTETTTKPYASGEHVKPYKDMAFIESVKDKEGQKPSLISSKAAIEDDYREKGVKELTNKIEHYNNLKGSGRFETDRLGIVLGCPQPKDDVIQLWGALAGHSITRRLYENGEETKGNDLDFGPFGNRILYDSRDNEVLQAALRFGREEADGERGATVYVHTSTFPEWVQPEKNIPKINEWGAEDGFNAVIDTIKDRDDWKTGEWKTTELAESIDNVDKRQVLNILRDTLAEEGYIDSRRGGRGNAHIWSNNCLEEAGDYGIVEW